MGEQTEGFLSTKDSYMSEAVPCAVKANAALTLRVPEQRQKYKSKDDTWKTEELRKHLKAMQSDGGNDRRHRERRHHREEDRRRHKPDEKTDERERPKNPERTRHIDRERGETQEPRKEKTREGDGHHASERQRTKDREKMERTDSGEKPVKESRTSDLSREERKRRDSQDKSKLRSEDRERRHREKDERKRESEEREDRKLRHRKQGEELNSQGTNEERRSERKPKETSEREKRHHSRRERETHAEQRSKEESPAYSDSAKEKHLREGDQEQRHRDKKDRRTRAHETRKTNSPENISISKSRLKEAPAKQESLDEKEVEEILYNTDTANDESTNYEEDFEDYDDDFEDASDEDKATERAAEPKPVTRNAEVMEIQKAMFLENESVSPSAQRHRASDLQDDERSSEGRSSTPRKSAQQRVFIDFGSAKQHQINGQNSNNQKKRSVEILRLVDLDFSSTFSLLDLPPVKEYEMYIRNFGKTNTKQAYVQCNEDAVERENQTEEIDLEERWTQHPGEGAVVCGGPKNDTVQDTGVVAKVDSQRLTTFLRSACQVITVLLEENRAEEQSNYKVQSRDPCLPISESCFHLNTNLPFLQGRSVYQLQFSEAQRHLMLTVHGSGPGSETGGLRAKYIICVWNIWQPSSPQKILICESEVTCCCFSPGKASLVFAGTADGSLLVWDLREDMNIHQTMRMEDINWTFRSSTFSTDGIFAQVNHTHPVRAVEPVPSTETKDHGISSLASPEEMSGLSFQVASLDESGHIILWVVVELRRADLAGSPSDLGLIPGGKVKLIHSSSIHLSDRFLHKDVLLLGSPQTLNMKFLPRDFNHFVIGTDIGLVTHGTRYGLVEPPLQYTSLHSKLRPTQVTAIDFSPFGAAAFLAGCSDGSIRLHTLSSELPATEWSDSTNGRPVTALQWSLTRPTVFFVLDAASSIYIWDLSQNNLHPIAKESITPDRVLSMSVFGEPEKNSHVTGLALGKSSGQVEIQHIKKNLAKMQPQELETFHLLLQEIP